MASRQCRFHECAMRSTSHANTPGAVFATQIHSSVTGQRFVPARTPPRNWQWSSTYAVFDTGSNGNRYPASRSQRLYRGRMGAGWWNLLSRYRSDTQRSQSYKQKLVLPSYLSTEMKQSQLPSAKRMRALREDRRARGFKQYTIFLHDLDAEKWLRAIDELNQKRGLNQASQAR